MADRRYTTQEELERDFEGRIANAEQADRAELRVAKAEALLAFRQQEAEERELSAYRRLAIVDFPGAGQFPELVNGRSEEEIRASAKDIHERVQGLIKKETPPAPFEQVRERADSLYGRAGAGGTGPGSGAPTTYVSPDREKERWLQGFAQRFNEAPRDPYGSRIGISASDIDRYVVDRAVGHIGKVVRFWGRLTRGEFA